MNKFVNQIQVDCSGFSIPQVICIGDQVSVFVADPDVVRSRPEKLHSKARQNLVSFLTKDLTNRWDLLEPFEIVVKTTFRLRTVFRCRNLPHNLYVGQPRHPTCCCSLQSLPTLIRDSSKARTQ